VGWWERRRRRQRRRRGRDCDVIDCDVCDCDCNPFLLGSMRLSSLFLLVASLGVRTPLASRAGLVAIRGYQRWLSPRLRGSCPHTPSCSAYGAEAIGRHGLADGSRLVAARLRRCSSGVPAGTADPVP
jgi:putative component of membrane protein insertase Oxa1/YidC/SpoIIIJ protein YidD